MKTKTFDCVEMKGAGAARVYEQLKDMNVDEQIAYWRRRNRAFLKRHKKLAARKG